MPRVVISPRAGPDAPRAQTVIVVAFQFSLAYQAARGAQRAGYTVCVLGRDQARGFRYSLVCKEYRELAYRPDHDSAMDAAAEIMRYAAHVGASVVIPGDVVATRLLIAIRDRLGLPTCLLPDAHTFDTFNDKWLFQQYCQRAGVRVPDSWIVDSREAIVRGVASGRLRFPLVAKPVVGMAGHGVHILRQARDIAALGVVAERLIVQAFIQGRDRDISVLARGGTVLASAVQFRTKRRFDFTGSAQLFAMAERLVAASGFEGVAHFDAVEEDGTGKFYMVECNPRFWYSMFALVGAGVNMVGLSMAHATAAAAGQTTPTRTLVPAGRRAVLDFLQLKWSPAMFTMLGYYLQDLPGVICDRRHLFDGRAPGVGDVHDQLRQLACVANGAAPVAAAVD